MWCFGLRSGDSGDSGDRGEDADGERDDIVWEQLYYVRQTNNAVHHSRGCALVVVVVENNGRKINADAIGSLLRSAVVTPRSMVLTTVICQGLRTVLNWYGVDYSSREYSSTRRVLESSE